MTAVSHVERERTTGRGRLLLAAAVVAVPAAAVVTTAAAALARAAGVDLEVPAGGERVPLPGIAVVTGFFSLVGVVLAAALLRWSRRPAEHFLRTTVALTAVSLVPPFLAGADRPTALTLAALHLVAAAVVVPTLGRALRQP